MGRSDEILDIAQELIQIRGYNAFSFQDISQRLGIKKASVQFYFSKKADLGKQVVIRYRESMREQMEALIQMEEMPAIEKFNAYLGPFFQLSDTKMMICLCGVLGGEFTTLPEVVQAEVSTFFRMHEDWLETLLEQGRNDGSFTFAMPSKHLAMTLFSTLQGGLLVSRTNGDLKYFEQVATTLRQLIGANSDQ